MLLRVPFQIDLRWKESEETCAGYWLLKQELLTTDSVLTHTGIVPGVGAISKFIVKNPLFDYVFEPLTGPKATEKATSNYVRTALPQTLWGRALGCPGDLARQFTQNPG
jgi:hypothetical protein